MFCLFKFLLDLFSVTSNFGDVINEFWKPGCFGIIDDDKGALYRNRYAIGGLIAPTIIKAYEHDKQHGTQKLKAYLKAVYDDNFEGALHALGIEPNEQGIAILIKNMKARDAKINDDMER